jgi:hypothetical protein
LVRGTASKDLTRIKQGFSRLHGKVRDRGASRGGGSNARAERRHSYPCNPLNPCLICVKSLLASPGSTSSRCQPRSRPATEPCDVTAKRPRATDPRFRRVTLTGLDPTIHRTSMVPDMKTSGVAARDARVEPSMTRSRVSRGLTALVFVP